MEATKKYRIYIGSENITAIYRAFDSFFDCYTVIPAKGVWHGKLEVCYIVEIIADEKKYNVIYNICKQLNIELQQESILMTDEHTHTQLI